MPNESLPHSLHFPSQPAWQQLLREVPHWLAPGALQAAYARDPGRAQRYVTSACGITLDYARQSIDEAVRSQLFTLARAMRVEETRDAMLRGEKINRTETRAVLHTALRAPRTASIRVDEQDVVPEVHAVLDRMSAFAAQLRAGVWRGYRGEPISDVVNLGIGGSDLGPAMVCAALEDYGLQAYRQAAAAGEPAILPRMHFVSTVDGWQLARTLEGLDPARTLFVVVSKTFTTQETLINARAARAWLLAAAGSGQDEGAVVKKHFVAVSTHHAAVAAFGIDPAQMFPFWDWVGGRFSLCSAVGLSVLLSIGETHFRALLAGARAMDEHFAQAPLEENLPVLLALLGIWQINGLGAQSHLISPYNQPLHRLPAYLQQLEMESNGKSVRLDGTPVDYATCPVIWGEPGINGQHAYYQLLHQGTPRIPVDFIIARDYPRRAEPWHRTLCANLLAQSEALLHGRDMEAAIASAAAERRTVHAQERTPRAETLLHRVFPGNRASNLIVLDRLDPAHLGSLIALYEHKVMVQGAIWAIDSFDQWGVELGKQLARGIETDLGASPSTAPSPYDATTARWIALLRGNGG